MASPSNGRLEMLVIRRKVDEKVVIACPNGDEIVVLVSDIQSRGHTVQLGIDAPLAYEINRDPI